MKREEWEKENIEIGDIIINNATENKTSEKIRDAVKKYFHPPFDTPMAQFCTSVNVAKGTIELIYIDQYGNTKRISFSIKEK